MRRWMTLAAMSGKLAAHSWMACTSRCRYSGAFSSSRYCVFISSFISTITTSAHMPPSAPPLSPPAPTRHYRQHHHLHHLRLHATISTITTCVHMPPSLRTHCKLGPMLRHLLT